MLCQVSRSGDHWKEQEELKVMKGDWDCENVVSSTGQDGIHHGSKGSEHTFETNSLCRETKAGGQLDLQEMSRGVESNWSGENDVNSTE